MRKLWLRKEVLQNLVSTFSEDSRFIRICPGKHIAFSNIWISIASVLSVFDIEKTKDGKGRVLEPTLDVVPGLTV